ncbi:DUF3445 domain-containing protein [Fictibacillus aquaticus]|uniref:DUF3445 domain-containing protein n=1 Tax=Fictibacillus aquaticus TaxID=2021314 RepID=A0A235F6K9_9BACL|nr:DUF3445 domain-containing protein [Fictibacillus aquaticus]OYD56577.1 hypothetical protein CGZ90_16325 [Fictibacillus aquaticus]
MVWTETLERFPYPFKEDVYRYSNNSVPMENPISVEMNSRYVEEIKLKRQLLSDHPERCFQSLPHSIKAQWEAAALVMEQLAGAYPETFSLKKNGREWTFQNKTLNEMQSFTYGDTASLDHEPLDFVGRHVQEDLILMMQRDGDLYLDAGQLCFPANWSLAFNLGMKFRQIHHPIPGFKEEGLDSRILKFLLRLESGVPWERKNWSLMAGDRLDTSLETFDEWGKLRKTVTRDNAGEFVHLRIEVQKLFRLPQTHSILFTIHTYVISLERFCENPEWKRQFYEILKELPPHITDYKGIGRYKGAVLAYLEEQL